MYGAHLSRCRFLLLTAQANPARFTAQALFVGDGRSTSCGSSGRRPCRGMGSFRRALCFRSCPADPSSLPLRLPIGRAKPLESRRVSEIHRDGLRKGRDSARIPARLPMSRRTGSVCRRAIGSGRGVVWGFRAAVRTLPKLFRRKLPSACSRTTGCRLTRCRTAG